jgi:glycosyltransferase involved in cell wall biosynthesis
MLPNLNCGGTERMYFNLCNNLNRDKFEISLCLNKAEGECLLPLISPDVKIIDLNSVWHRYPLFKIINTIKTEKPDIVMASITWFNIFLATFKFLLPKRVKYIARESNILSLIIKTERWWIKLLEKRYRKFDYFVAQSMDMKEDLICHLSISENKISVINNFVDTAFISRKLQENVPQIFTQNKIHLLSIGRLEEQKGFDMLLNSFSRIKNRERFQLAIFGQGILKDALQKQIIDLQMESDVFLLDVTNNPYKYMEQADIFISSSRYEGFPNVVIEALTCGLPVIANNYQGGINEILRHTEFGCIIDIQNSAEFEKAIPEVLNKDRNVIKRKAAELYSKDRILALYEQMFSSIHASR